MHVWSTSFMEKGQEVQDREATVPGCSGKPPNKTRKKKRWVLNNAKEMSIDAAVAAVLSELHGIFTLREEYKNSTVLGGKHCSPNPMLRQNLAGLCGGCAVGIWHHNSTHCVTFSCLACCVASVLQPCHTWLGAATWCGPWQLNSGAGLNFRHWTSLQRNLTAAQIWRECNLTPD